MFVKKEEVQVDLQSSAFPNVTDSSNMTPPKDTKREFLDFMSLLSLLDKYPQKLQLVDALSINMDLLDTSNFPNDAKVLPYLILQKIMMYDNYRPLCKLMSKNVPQLKIHPVDILVALLHCCDNILRQDLLSRLHTCKLAIPLLLSDPNNETVTLLFWAIRSIVCEWKCKIDTVVTPKESRIVDYKGPIISFIRVGKATSPKDFSKSRMLNMVIGEEKYFFHWNCPGGSFNRKFVDGLVELSCYLPSGKESDVFPDAVIFLNLHGEARHHVMQLDFIKKISFMSFLILLESTLDNSILNLTQELAVLPGGLAIIFPDYDHFCTLQNSSGLLEMMSEKKITHLNIKDKNEDEIKSQIQSFISQNICIANPSQFLSISNGVTTAQKIGIKIDEYDMDCKEGYTKATGVIQILDSIPATDAKAKMLPLQGSKLWHKWAKHDKESFQKPKEGAVPYYNSTVDQKKKKIRFEQWHCVERMTPLMNSFTSNLQNCKASVRAYTLQWLKLFLDDRSRKTLPGMRIEYERIRAELQKARNEGTLETSPVVKKLINELKMKNMALIEGSLGLEHLFRELGQMYEAVKDCDKQHSVTFFPRIMVDILNQGYPVELMDGDASHVPITWVSAVLDQLKVFHKGKKLFVISVLGIQSTGKSTLLNTMFGLQFNVSAGRCTRGAFIQLLPVKNSLMCECVLIIDTEGLRAPELSSTESVLHDNELAAFVIGLADVAIINIYGEAPGDLNDILQTAVHAFIRMKNVDLNLHCHFVHQNVTALLIDSKIKFAQQSFQDKLNQMTKYAAIAEHCESEYSLFSDVIKFDGSKDITYFPGLWKGDPPMAPVNFGYSDKALQLKSMLMALVGSKMKKDSNFDNFLSLVKKLWNAVCRENYIFSFKNTQEVVAYNDLDEAFSRWSWVMHRQMLEWKQQTKNNISSCPHSQLSATEMTCLKKADNMLLETYTKLANEMKKFFETNERSDTLAQWKSRYEIRLQHLKDDCIKDAKKQCELLKLNRVGHLKLENIQNQYRKQLLQQIQELVAKAKQHNTKLTQKELEKKFDEKWQLWIKEFPDQEYKSMYTSDDQIALTVSDVLQDLLAKDLSILSPKIPGSLSLSEQRKCDLHITIDPSIHLSTCTTSYQSAAYNTGVARKFTTFLGFSKSKSKSEEYSSAVKHAQKASNDFFVKAKDEFRKIKQNFHNFDRSYAFYLLKTFTDDIESYNKNHQYMFTSEYKVDMALTFASYMKTEFIALMKVIRTNNDPIETFKRLKTTYFHTFLAQYKNISDDETAARNLYQLLSVSIETAVVETLPAKIADKMKSSDASFNQKKYFKVKVLKDLARAKRFDLFQTYLTDIKSSFESWAKVYVKDFCEHKQLPLAKSIVHEIIVKIDTTVKSLNRSISIMQWLQRFHDTMSGTLTVDLGEMQDITGATHIVSISEHFITTFSELILQEEGRIMKVIADPHSKFSDITKWTTSPHVLLCESFIGCIERCPFCGEQCEITDSNHLQCGKDHYIHIHRPQCLGRCTWHISKQLILDLCTFSVESECLFWNQDTNGSWVPCKDYRTIYKNWCISNESPTEAPKYWQWFISCYLKNIIEWVGAAPTSIDHLNWKAVTQKMAVNSLSEVYKITT